MLIILRTKSFLWVKSGQRYYAYNKVTQNLRGSFFWDTLYLGSNSKEHSVLLIIQDSKVYRSYGKLQLKIPLFKVLHLICNSQGKSERLNQSITLLPAAEAVMMSSKEDVMIWTALMLASCGLVSPLNVTWKVISSYIQMHMKTSLREHLCKV